MNLEFINSLKTNDFALNKNFLSPDELVKISSEVDVLNFEGAFHRAGIGTGQDFQIRQDIRSDLILWLEPETATVTQKIIWQRLEILKNYLNQNLMMGLWSFEGHYALYQPGSFYKRHIDCFRDDDARVLSFVLYLNEDWKEGDGGQLKLYPNHPTIEVTPKGGTLICFLSHKVEHEVLMTNKIRKSFTGWFKKRTT